MRVNRILETARYAAGRSVLFLFRGGATGEPFDTGGGVIPAHAGGPPTHFAFSVAAEDVEPWAVKLQTEPEVLVPHLILDGSDS